MRAIIERETFVRTKNGQSHRENKTNLHWLAEIAAKNSREHEPDPQTKYETIVIYFVTIVLLILLSV